MRDGTVLFFNVTDPPTPEETAASTALQNEWRSVLVRRSDLPVDTLEPADALAGSPPQEYLDAIANYPGGVVTANTETAPDALLIIPASGSITVAATLQLYLAVANVMDDSVVLADMTANLSVAWTSDNPAIATVSAGVVTGVAAGSAVITATATFETDKTATATATVTVA